MPSTDYLYRIQTMRVSRREALRYAVVAGVGLVAIPLIGCGEDEEEAKATSTPVATAVPPSGFFDSDGVKIHYETFGEGKPLVLVHGFVLNITYNWVNSGLVDALQPVRRVVALDCRGHGQSDKPHDPAAYSSEKMAGDVLNLMDHLGIEKADLFGYSMGSGISCYLLACHRERFNSVILAGTGDRLVLRSTDESRSDAMVNAMLAEDTRRSPTLQSGPSVPSLMRYPTATSRRSPPAPSVCASPGPSAVPIPLPSTSLSSS